MNPSKEKVDELLAELETEPGQPDYKIVSRIRSLRDDDVEGEGCPEWSYEAMALSFAENTKNVMKDREPTTAR